jgi:hypothetical protein
MMQDYGFELSKAAGIPHEVLAGEVALSSVDVNTKMSWMRKRNTTRTEDRAYCLLGLFSVYLSPIYGEREHATVRLQREIAAVSGLADSCNFGSHEFHFLGPQKMNVKWESAL